MRIGYARDVRSTPIIEAQINILQSANCQKIFTSRRELEKANIIRTIKDFIREGEDTIVICKLMCLDKTTKEIVKLFHEFDEMKLSFESIEENLIVNQDNWGIAISAVNLYLDLKHSFNND